MQEVKRALRKQLIARRRGLDSVQKRLADESIFGQLKPLIMQADAVLTYVSTDIEVDTHRVLEFCFEQGIPVAVPVSGDSELDFYEIHGKDELSVGRFGIMEPIKREDIFVGGERSLCIVPALCADGEGLRLGYGRGYYDRFLSRFKGKSAIVCYSDFKMEVPSEPHDKKADMTIFDKT
ncbi:MAG: 5-formyltetrahydrofolate cyclo-ligase [Ruminococcaceae bacterium]|nr:5-formyltetrahydrofolate cyclo-ligase [Oscillospiraceae bacterium]